MSVEAVAGWLSTGNAALAAETIVSGFENFQPLKETIAQSILKGARYTKDNLVPDRIVVRFDSYNPHVISAIERQSMQLIREMSNGTREGIRAYLDAGLRMGVNPRTTARHVRELIGLTDRQTLAIANYRRFLETGKMEALQRALRDKRFDSTILRAIEGKKDLTPQQIDKFVEAYQRKYLKYRSEVIARTESMQALHEGQRVIWQQAVSQGQIDGGLMVRKWYVAPGERTCDSCLKVAQLNEQGVGLEEEFVTANGTIYGPPLHPQCRCTTFTKPRFR